jgi:hypothetical protein
VTDHPLLLFLFLMANIAISFGYFYLAAFVIPSIRVQLMRTKIGGASFLFLCALTHLDMAFSGLFHPHMTMGEMAVQWHMLAIHLPQAVCVWMFVTGLYIEVGRWSRRPDDESGPVKGIPPQV